MFPVQRTVHMTCKACKCTTLLIAHALLNICSSALVCPLQEGSTFWPYTWQDCELSYAVKAVTNGGYCGVEHAHGVNCTAGNFTQFPVAMDIFLEDIALPAKDPRFAPDGPVLNFFREKPKSWEHYFNKGMKKLGNVGATWGNKKVRHQGCLWRVKNCASHIAGPHRNACMAVAPLVIGHCPLFGYPFGS
jgi:hypothetical protein